MTESEEFVILAPVWFKGRRRRTEVELSVGHWCQKPVQNLRRLYDNIFLCLVVGERENDWLTSSGQQVCDKNWKQKHERCRTTPGRLLPSFPVLSGRTENWLQPFMWSVLYLMKSSSVGFCPLTPNPESDAAATSACTANSGWCLVCGSSTAPSADGGRLKKWTI